MSLLLQGSYYRAFSIHCRRHVHHDRHISLFGLLHFGYVIARSALPTNSAS
jgi:hypothetical protein